MDYLNKLKSHPYISENVSLEIYNYPFNYIIIDNLFKPEIYSKISKKFPQYTSRKEKPFGQVGTNSGNFYEAIIYGIVENDCVDGFEFFIDPFWKNYISDIFNISLNEHTAYSTHFHKGSKENPSKNGWIHKDLSICCAINDPSKEVKIVSDCEYADDSNGQPHTSKIIRSVANLFYLNNIENISEDDGGGTGIYTSYQHSSLVKSILPRNNRLFAFEISPLSYHAFIGAKFDRSAIVQWFHSDPLHIIEKHLDKFKQQWKDSQFVFERWKDKDLWQIEQHPKYSKIFKKSIIEILSN